jgi:exopolysaccharide/PEP-CTERM locus tyrosine autokinase
MGKFFDALQKATVKTEENKRTKTEEQTAPSIEPASKRAKTKQQIVTPIEQKSKRAKTEQQTVSPSERESKRAETEQPIVRPIEQKSKRVRVKEQTARPIEPVSPVDQDAIDSLRLGSSLQEPHAIESRVQLHTMNELLVTSSPAGNQQFKFAAEQFKMLRSHLLFPTDRSNPRTIMVTSAIPGEGKSIVAGNLAVSIALGKQEHVLLMECDLRRPSVCKIFGLGNCRGLSDYLQENADLSDLLCKTPVDKLTILPGGTMTTTPYELLSSQRMLDLLQEVKNRYEDRYIIMDSTPAQVAAETGVLSKFVDGVVMVVRYGKSSRKVVQETVAKVGLDKILGVVFNCTEGSFVDEYYYKYYGGDQQKTSRRFKRK